MIQKKTLKSSKFSSVALFSSLGNFIYSNKELCDLIKKYQPHILFINNLTYEKLNFTIFESYGIWVNVILIPDKRFIAYCSRNFEGGMEYSDVHAIYSSPLPAYNIGFIYVFSQWLNETL